MKSKYTDQKWAFAVAAAIFASLHGSAFAAAVIYEPFNYSTGHTDLSQNTSYGQGLTGGWFAGRNVNTWTDNGGTGLTYGSLATGGAAARNNGGWAGANIAINTSTSGYSSLLSDGGELWFSMIYEHNSSSQRSAFVLGNTGFDSSNGDLKELAAGETGVGFGRASNGNFYANVWSDSDALVALNWGSQIQNAPTGNVSNSGNAAPAGKYFVVGHVQWGATATDNDTVTLYLPGTDLALGSAVSVSNGVIADQSDFDVIGFTNLSNYAMFDEIRIGATYASVSPIPEPSTALLGGLGLLALLRRRR